MDDNTLLAKIQISVSLSEQTLAWMNRYFPDAWFSQENGNAFLEKYGDDWWNSIESIIKEEIQGFFHESGLSSDDLPVIGHVETYDGSLITEIPILMRGTIEYVSSILKKPVGNLTEFLVSLSKRINELLTKNEPIYRREISKSLIHAAKKHIVEQDEDTDSSGNVPPQTPPPPPPPEDVVIVYFRFDPSPLAALTVTKENALLELKVTLPILKNLYRVYRRKLPASIPDISPRDKLTDISNRVRILSVVIYESVDTYDTWIGDTDQIFTRETIDWSDVDIFVETLCEFISNTVDRYRDREKIDKQRDQIINLIEKNAKLSKDNTKQEDEISRLKTEIKRDSRKKKDLGKDERKCLKRLSKTKAALIESETKNMQLAEENIECANKNRQYDRRNKFLVDALDLFKRREDTVFLKCFLTEAFAEQMPMELKRHALELYKLAAERGNENLEYLEAEKSKYDDYVPLWIDEQIREQKGELERINGIIEKLE